MLVLFLLHLQSLLLIYLLSLPLKDEPSFRNMLSLITLLTHSLFFVNDVSADFPLDVSIYADIFSFTISALYVNWYIRCLLVVFLLPFIFITLIIPTKAL